MCVNDSSCGVTVVNSHRYLAKSNDNLEKKQSSLCEPSALVQKKEEKKEIQSKQNIKSSDVSAK